MPEFVVECYWPRLTANDVDDAVDRVDAACANTADVRPTSCLLVPSDGLVLFVFDARSEADVRQCSHAAELPFDRITRSHVIGTRGDNRTNTVPNGRPDTT